MADITIRIGAQDKASASLRKVGVGVRALGAGAERTARRVGHATKGMMASFGRLRIGVAGMVAGLAAAAASRSMISLASDAEETMGKFNVVFGANAKVMKTWSDEQAKALGTSRVEMAGMLSGMQDLLVPMGVAPEQASGMSKTFSQLAVDLGSFNNLGTDQTFRDLQAAVTGSGEVMKKYGVVLTEAAVKQELMNMGLDPKNTNNAEKAQARLNIILRSTTAAQGDAIRTQGSFANQMKRVGAAFKDIRATAGTPFLAPLSKMLEGLSERLRGMEPTIKRVSVIFLTVFKSISNIVSSFVSTVFGGLKKLVGYLTGTSDSFTDFGRGVIKAVTWVEVVLTDLPTTFGVVFNKMAEIAVRLADTFRHWFTVVIPGYMRWFGESTFQLMVGLAKNAPQILVNMARTIGNSVQSVFNTIISKVAGLMEKLASKLADVMGRVASIDPTGLAGRVEKELRRSAQFAEAFQSELNQRTEQNTEALASNLAEIQNGFASAVQNMPSLPDIPERSVTQLEKNFAAAAAGAGSELGKQFTAKVGERLRAFGGDNAGAWFGLKGMFDSAAAAVKDAINTAPTAVADATKAAAASVAATQAVQSRVLTGRGTSNVQDTIKENTKKANDLVQKGNGILATIAGLLEGNKDDVNIKVIKA